MFEEDRAAFLADFGEDVTIGGQPARGIWYDAYVDALGVASTGPALGAFSVDLPALTVNTTTLVRGAVTYRIVDDQPDGTGWTILRLQKQ